MRVFKKTGNHFFKRSLDVERCNETIHKGGVLRRWDFHSCLKSLNSQFGLDFLNFSFCPFLIEVNIFHSLPRGPDHNHHNFMNALVTTALALLVSLISMSFHVRYRFLPWFDWTNITSPHVGRQFHSLRYRMPWVWVTLFKISFLQFATVFSCYYY